MTSGCGSDCHYYPQYDWGFDYEFEPYLFTPRGISVDASGQFIDLNKVDRLTLETIECIDKEFSGLDKEEREMAWCQSVEYRQLPLSCVKVKIPNNWVLACDGKTQLLNDLAPQEGCDAKGFEYDPNCPCKWRAGLMHDIIIITPNLFLYKDPLVKILTGCWHPWGSPTLTKCMN